MADWNPRVNELFLNALDLASDPERRAFLDTACGEDTSLRGAVEALLRAHDAAGSLLERPALADATALPAPSVEPREAMQPGTRIGPYKLLEIIGEGGMGSVWMAEQSEPVRRMVAVKLIKPGMDSRAVLARFEAERQALALMDHPNIARVLDAGATAAGQPYFVMELVKGLPLTKYCDERRLKPRERLELFIPICQAVQHAHQKGIIHRDLKPSNVLIALYDGRPVPKVIDFGIAKATGEPLTERTLFTGYGALVGTLEYMSPEQAELNQLDIDTRSDVYSLGVLLYELLTGTTPLDRNRVQESALLELLRRIREEEPPTPSTRLSASDALVSLSEQRQTEPAKLARLLRGDLDWIVMKALEKDRQRRYATANDLAEDVGRYLRDEPVVAGPPRASYRLRKFVKRNRGSVLAATVVLLALVAGVVGTSVGLAQAVEAERNAVEAERVAVAARNDEARQRKAAQESAAKAEKSAEMEKSARLQMQEAYYKNPVIDGTAAKPVLTFKQDGPDLLVSTKMLINDSPHALWTRAIVEGSSVQLHYVVYHNNWLTRRGIREIDVVWRIPNHRQGAHPYVVRGHRFYPDGTELTALLPQLKHLKDVEDKAKGLLK